jgi:hypothetical protein
MSTKSGLLRHSDFRKNVVAWWVVVNVLPDGTLEPLAPVPLIIEGIPIPYMSQSDSEEKPVYFPSFCIPVTYRNKTTDLHGLKWDMSYAEFSIPANGKLAPNIWRCRLYSSKKQAERGVELLMYPATLEEVEISRKNAEFVAAIRSKPQPVYEPYTKEPDELISNRHRYLRAPGTKLRRLVKHSISSAYKLLCVRQDSFGKMFFPDVSVGVTVPAPPEITVTITVIPGSTGRRREKKLTRRKLKKIDRIKKIKDYDSLETKVLQGESWLLNSQFARTLTDIKDRQYYGSSPS